MEASKDVSHACTLSVKNGIADISPFAANITLTPYQGFSCYILPMYVRNTLDLSYFLCPVYVLFSRLPLPLVEAVLGWNKPKEQAKHTVSMQTELHDFGGVWRVRCIGSFVRHRVWRRAAVSNQLGAPPPWNRYSAFRTPFICHLNGVFLEGTRWSHCWHFARSEDTESSRPAVCRLAPSKGHSLCKVQHNDGCWYHLSSWLLLVCACGGSV